MSQLNYVWRLIATASAFTLFGIGGVLVPLLAAPLLLLCYPQKRTRQLRARALMNQLFALFIAYMRCVGILRWEFQKIERLRTPGQLIIANHPTLLDVVFLLALVPKANCIVKGALLKNPVMRGFVSMTGFIINDGGERLVEQGAASLAQGDSLLIFPEGTRTRDGDRLNSFQRGAAHIALRAGVPPTPVLIQCTPATLSKQHRWYDIPPRRFVISVRTMARVPIARYQDLPTPQGARKLTQHLENFFEQVINRNDTRGIAAGTERNDYRDIGVGGYSGR